MGRTEQGRIYILLISTLQCEVHQPSVEDANANANTPRRTDDNDQTLSLRELTLAEGGYFIPHTRSVDHHPSP